MFADAKKPNEGVLIVVSIGRDKFEVAVRSEDSWNDIIDRVSDLSGIPSSGLRLFHKGKIANVEERPLETGLKQGTKVLCMKSGKQHKLEEKQSRRAQEANRARAATELLESHQEASGASTAGRASRTDTAPLVVPEEHFYVRVAYLGKKHNAVFADHAWADVTVADLKGKLVELTGIAAKDQRILFNGKSDFSDSNRLSVDLEAKRGAMMMLLATRGHHEAVDSNSDIARLLDSVKGLVTTVSGLRRRIESRLLSDEFEVTIALRQAADEAHRLQGNVEAVRVWPKGDNSKELLLNDIEKLLETISDLRRSPSE